MTRVIVACLIYSVRLVLFRRTQILSSLIEDTFFFRSNEIISHHIFTCVESTSGNPSISKLSILQKLISTLKKSNFLCNPRWLVREADSITFIMSTDIIREMSVLTILSINKVFMQIALKYSSHDQFCLLFSHAQTVLSTMREPWL